MSWTLFLTWLFGIYFLYYGIVICFDLLGLGKKPISSDGGDHIITYAEDMVATSVEHEPATPPVYPKPPSLEDTPTQGEHPFNELEVEFGEAPEHEVIRPIVAVNTTGAVSGIVALARLLESGVLDNDDRPMEQLTESQKKLRTIQQEAAEKAKGATLPFQETLE
ncbi:hypothetical protein [Mucilaginibacter lappiensis]|uniref:Uncharacterized protein n=1 Tax=Mucilaginibacter lappiensis TaxID=354630 RepID=A0A841JUL6_9SPHI|nr:hypothetical protein [Mucilaginibacter lappiensis]MBB6131521.1 hypothetical protein [Mucilaginibacter lappiensis]